MEKSEMQVATMSYYLARGISIVGRCGRRGRNRAVLRCWSNTIRILRLYRGCKVTGLQVSPQGFFWSGLGLEYYPAVRTKTRKSGHSTTATT